MTIRSSFAVGFTVLALTISVFCLTASAQEQVKVYVFAQTGTDGFTDSERIQDSVNDLKEAINKSKRVTTAFTKEGAELTLEVVSSDHEKVGTESNTTISRGILGGIHSNTTTQDKTLPSLTAILRVKGSDYQKELTITRQMFWKDLAKNIATQLDDWVKLNRERLNAIRSTQ